MPAKLDIKQSGRLRMHNGRSVSDAFYSKHSHTDKSTLIGCMVTLSNANVR
ncbi:hypothetical protein FOVG_16552 [Fusarium oxysporum f. sp. pisi HDV247]|uniref:Uncharacterized protein n=1 Tax=Fusarium oxysporum f. sp. pisi HDV247 TaxID=1080344 RepID=W9NHJ7_FUSOX|nr:hypothetical protein FOVG_16552 [Fusarium oxysporum f. sp. pisi HDV247]